MIPKSEEPSTTHDAMRIWTALAVSASFAVAACSHAPNGSSTNGVSTTSASSLRESNVPPFAPPEPDVPASISVIEALGNTARYEGRKVQIAGVYGKKIQGLFATREHEQLNVVEYGLALDLQSCTGEPLDSSNFFDLGLLDGKYVRVTATLSFRARGQVFRVGLCDMTKIAEAGFKSDDLVVLPPKGASPPPPDGEGNKVKKAE